MLNRWNFLKPGFYEGIKVESEAVDSLVSIWTYGETVRDAVGRFLTPLSQGGGFALSRSGRADLDRDDVDIVELLVLYRRGVSP